MPTVFIHTEKFKTINVKVQFRSGLERERVSKRYLLSRMMVKTGSFETESEFLKFGASLRCAPHFSGRKRTDHLVSFNLEFINSKFVKEDLNLLEKCPKY